MRKRWERRGTEAEGREFGKISGRTGDTFFEVGRERITSLKRAEPEARPAA